MKKIIYLILVTIGMSACNDEFSEYNNTLINSPECIVYPMKLSQSRASSFETDWENMNQVTISESECINLPWGDIKDANMPYTFVMDIKKEDGWKMLFHTLTPEAESNMRYIALYNQRTGLLKVLYYLKTDAFANNSGAWELDFTTPRPYFNHTLELAVPQNTENVNYWGCSNAVKQGHKPFKLGWNGFQVQLAYVPNITSDYTLDIDSHCMNNIEANLLGSTQSYTQGTILTHGSTNPFTALTGDLASTFGQEAKDFLESKLDSGEVKGNNETGTRSASLIAGIGGNVVKYGLNKIFSKLTASFSQPTTTRSDVELTTKGEFSITGNLSFNSNSPARSLRANFSKNYVGELGVWNLANQPIIYIDPRADHVPNTMDNQYKEYTYQMRGISRYAYDLRINPELTPYIKDQWVDIDLVRYYHASDRPQIPNIFTFGTLGSIYYGFGGGYYTTDKLIYKEHMGAGSMYDEFLDNYTFYSRMSLYNTYGGPLPIVFAPNVESYENKTFNSTNLFMKFSLYLVTEFEGKRDTTVSTRTFVPQIEWDPTLYNALKDVDMRNLGHYEYLK